MKIPATSSQARHLLFCDIPDIYRDRLMDLQERTNGHVEAEYQRVKAEFEAKELQLKNDLATIHDFVMIAMRLNSEWYAESIWLIKETARQEVETIKQDEAAKTAIWQQSFEAILAENEGLRAELATMRKGVAHIGKSKTVADLKDRVREILK